MVRGSALYIVIVIALVIAIICSALIVSAYFYKTQYQRKMRADLLQSNLTSGINIMLAGDDQSYTVRKIRLFGGDQDSVVITKKPWGLFDVGIVKPFIQTDTLIRVFTIANQIDSLKWAALYLIDEDRTLSLSGKTEIIGNVFIPKAGVKQSYVNDKAYKGNEKLIIGIQHNSDKTLPVLNAQRLAELEKLLRIANVSTSTPPADSKISNSFNNKLKVFDFRRKAFNVTQNLDGYILLRSDTIVTIDSSARLNNVIICARSINVLEGFHGVCQLYATDSVHVGKNCMFDYPSVIGVMQFDAAVIKIPARITIDAGTKVNGTVFSYVRNGSDILPYISFGNHVNITGQVYAQGICNYKDDVTINGSTFARKFLYQNSYTRYENYLINISLNSNRLSSFYLTGNLLPVASNKQRILQWLK